MTSQAATREVAHKPTDEQIACVDAIASGANVMMDALAGCAKALRNDQPVLTPTGWRPICDLQVGDKVIGKDGAPYDVLGIFPQGEKELFELEFSDGTKSIATADHIWTMQRADHRQINRWMNVTTADLFRKPRSPSGSKANWGDGTRAYWFAPMCEPVHFANELEKLPIDPWLVGVLLGDGCLQERSVGFSSADGQIIHEVSILVELYFGLTVSKQAGQNYDYRITNPTQWHSNYLLDELRKLGMSNTRSQNKFVPKQYLHSSPENRLALLQGLMDTDGSADKSRATYCTTSLSLIQDVKFLVESLGGTCVTGEFVTTGYTAFRAQIKLPKGVIPFRLQRKVDNYWTGQRPPYRALESVKKVEPFEATCIKVASPDSLFLTSNFLPTHNTTTTVMAAQRVRVPALELVFNKRNAVEMTPKMPGNFKVQTMNGLGFGAWMRANPQVGKWDIDARKLGKLVSQLTKDRKVDLTSDQWEFTRKLVEGAMLAGITPGNIGDPLTLDTPEVWQDIADGLLMTEDDFALVYDIARQTLERSIDLARSGTISFDDQVYMPTMLGGKFPQYPFVGTDESQDLNLLNHQMIAKALRPDGRLLVVGDPLQSIYQFRGSTNDSMGKMLGLRPSTSWKRLPLETTFRCPKVVVERQKSHAPGFKAWHTNREGSFHRLPGVAKLQGKEATLAEHYWSFGDLEDLAQGGQIAVLCRNNGPLLSLAFKLLREGIGVSMLGRDIGKGLIALSRKLCPDDLTPRDSCAGLIDEWKESESSLARANGHEEKVSGIHDRAECLQAALVNAGVTDAGGMRRALNVLFSRDTGRCVLGSIHRSKGMEWDLVAILDPWRSPSKYAREAATRGDRSQMQQEKNLTYVAETRSKNILVHVNLEDFCV